MPGCALSQGYNLDCRDSVGGIKEVYFMEHGNVSGITSASGVISAITKASGKRFWKYSLVKNTSNASAALTGSDENGTLFSAETLQVILNSRSTAVRNEIMLLGKNNLVAVVVDRNGRAELYGKDNGLTLTTAPGTTGTAMGDRNGYTIDFAGMEKELPYEVQTSVISTLETPGA